MTDAAPLKQYLSTDVFGRHHVIYFVDGETTLPDGSIYKGLAVHSYWTLGPLIDDLLRDAARYRWLKNNNQMSNDVYRYAQGDPDGLIDAEIARERSDG